MFKRNFKTLQMLKNSLISIEMYAVPKVRVFHPWYGTLLGSQCALQDVKTLLSREQS